MPPAPVQYQVHCHRPIGTIADSRQKHIAIGTQGILPQQSLITVGSLDVDIALESHCIVHCAASVAGHFLQPAQQTGASEASIGQQQRTNVVGQIAQQARDKSLFQPVLRRVQFVVGRGPTEQRQPALAIADGGEKADALAAQVGPVNHNGRLALKFGQAADDGHQCALGLDGVKARIGEEAEDALFALVVVLGQSGHPGRGQFG